MSYYTQETLPVYYRYGDEQVLVGDDGHFYNSNGERVYYWVASGEMPEKGSNHAAGLYGQIDNEDKLAKNLSNHVRGAAGFYTEKEIKDAFHADKGMTTLSWKVSWDNYWGYLQEQQGLIETGQLSTALDAWYRDSKNARGDWLKANGGLRAMGGAKEGHRALSKMRGDFYNDSFYETYNSEIQQALMQKWGIPTQIQTNDGSLYRFNGSSLTKVWEAPDTDLVSTAAQIGVGLALSAALGPAVGAKVGGGMLGSAAGAAAASAGTQLLTTGSVDPKSVLAAGVIGGINPGGTVANEYAPWKVNGEWALGGAPPSSFYGGLVSGTVNDLVSTAITEGKVDLQGSLQAGLISGGINSAMNTWDEWNKNSQEGIADQLQHQDPAVYGDKVETLIKADGTRVDPSKLTNEQLQQALADGGQIVTGRTLAMQDALLDPKLNTTDFGAIIGEDGLLSFIPRADLGFIRAITDPVGDALDGVLNGFELGDVMVLRDGTKIPMEGMTDAEYQNYVLNEGGQVYSQSTIGLLNNPIVDGATNLLSGLLPSGDNQLNENLQSQKDKFGKEWDDLYADEYQVIDANGLPTGQLTVAGQAAKNDYIQLKMNTLGSFFFENSGGLNENYSWSPNPRGQSELWGTLVGLPNLYSTGTQNSWLPDGSSGTVTPPLNPDGTPVTPIMNLNPEIDPVGYAEYVASLDPSSAVLPSNDEAALRNWWLQQYYDYLNQGGSQGEDASVNLGVNTGVTNDTAVINTNTGGGSTTTNNSNVNTNAGGDDTSNVGGNGGTSVANNVTPIYGLPINEDGTATLPGGTTVDAASADAIYEQAYVNEELISTDSTQPASSALAGGGSDINFAGKDGLPPLWTELFGYTKISPYKKARLKVLDGMLSGMTGGAVGNMNALAFGANRNPYQKIGKSLIDAGMEPRG